MAINQYDSQPESPAAALPPGIGERLARLTAGDAKLREQADRIQLLSGRLGTADVMQIQKDLGATAATATQTQQRLQSLEASLTAGTQQLTKLGAELAQLLPQVKVLQADVALLKQAHEGLAKTVDHRIDDAFTRMSRLQEALAHLTARVDDCCSDEFRPPQPGKRNKSGA